MNDREEQLLRVSADIQNLAHGLLAHQRRQLQPAAIETITLTAGRPVWRSDVGERLEALSIGLLNPTVIPVYLGIAGNTPTIAGRSPSAPPRGLLVLPVDVRDVEVGADLSDPNTAAALGAGDATVFLLRFQTVQPAFLGVA